MLVKKFICLWQDLRCTWAHDGCWGPDIARVCSRSRAVDPFLSQPGKTFKWWFKWINGEFKWKSKITCGKPFFVNFNIWKRKKSMEALFVTDPLLSQHAKYFKNQFNIWRWKKTTQTSFVVDTFLFQPAVVLESIVKISILQTCQWTSCWINL